MNIGTFSERILENFSSILINWYKENRRDLPWRRTTDPYLIWVSEIILQQTRVAQGMDYYLRFTERFPDVYSLAQAAEDEVMKYWQGLGYYSRARNLHEAARQIGEAGAFPKTYKEVRALKGVGDYTAAAICSFAFGLPYATVDGNVYRLLSRYMGVDLPIDSTPGKKMFAALAEELLDKSRPGLHNQAVMEFGALQCVPQNPDCFSCPLSDSCMAFRQKRVNSLPVKQHKTKVTDRFLNYIDVRAGEYTFLYKRTGKDIWKNLYEFPLIETSSELAEEELLACPGFGAFFAEGEVPVVKCMQTRVKHLLSHRQLWINFYRVDLPAGTASFAGYLKVKRADLEQYAVPKPIHQYLESVL